MKSNCKKLKVYEVSIDFEQSSGSPKAQIALGKDFAKTLVCVIAKSTVNGSTTEIKKSHHICTDCKGVFTIPIPLNTHKLEVKIKIKTCCDPYTGQYKCIQVKKHFASYGEYDLVWRTYNGSENNMNDPQLGMLDTPLMRISESSYGPTGPTGNRGINDSGLAVRGPNNPNPRLVSNAICRSNGSTQNSLRLTDLVWGFGQFIDHEIDLTESNSGESANIITPSLEEDPTEQYPEYTISFTRSSFIPGSNPRQQPNQISSYIDGTNVYGYNTHRSFDIRRMDGSGKLKTILADNGEEILPYNTFGHANASLDGQSAEDLFLAGDVRANENILLMAYHTLFVREHNRLCDQIVADRPHWAGRDELIFQHARRILTGIMQAITYNEFIPALFGPNNTLDPYTGYDENVDPSIAIEFSTAGYRLGHSMLSSSLKIGESGSRLLRDSFFNPAWTQANGIESVLHGAATQIMQEIDGQVIDDIRDFLFGPPQDQMLLDLAVLNIQRGRDHGLPGYNAIRVAYGLAAKTSFAQITTNVDIQQKLEDLYIHPDHIDPWVGCLVEDHVAGAAIGELLVTILRDQFTRLRDGDRFYFENDPALSNLEKANIRNTLLSDVILRNSSTLAGKIQQNAFVL